jgi:nucleotide-binding universal stress UspA family protein
MLFSLGSGRGSRANNARSVKEVNMAFRHVLVPTDFSESAKRALRYAVEEAVLHGAKVTLLHIQPVDAGTEVYLVSGAPVSGLGSGVDVIAGGRLGSAPMPAPTVVPTR